MVDNHFICFTSVGGRLLELDGCMAGPVDHGATCNLLSDAANIIKKDFMARDPTNLNFSLCVMVPSSSLA